MRIDETLDPMNHPALNKAALTYVIGSFWTDQFRCRIKAANQDGVYTGYYCDFQGSSFSLFQAQGISLAVTPADANGQKTATLKAYVYFSGEAYYQEPGVLTVDVILPRTGPALIGLEVIDYRNPAKVLYTSGPTELPVIEGSIQIYP